MQQAVGGGAHDQALRHAVQEKHCGNWMCKDACWNPKANMCKECAPLAEEVETSARARFVRDQVGNDLGLEEEQRLARKGQLLAANCPHCGAESHGKKFCGECGKPTQAGPKVCGGCGARNEPGVKFCGDCRAKL